MRFQQSTNTVCDQCESYLSLVSRSCVNMKEANEMCEISSARDPMLYPFPRNSIELTKRRADTKTRRILSIRNTTSSNTSSVRKKALDQICIVIRLVSAWHSGARRFSFNSRARLKHIIELETRTENKTRRPHLRLSERCKQPAHRHIPKHILVLGKLDGRLKRAGVQNRIGDTIARAIVYDVGRVIRILTRADFLKLLNKT